MQQNVAQFPLTAVHPVSPEELIARARAMLPALAERAAQAEKDRKVPDETIADLQQAGLFKVLQPKRYGGYEMDPDVFFQIQMTLAEACMSSAWVYGVVAVHNWQLALFDDRAQQDVWGEDDSVLTSSTYMPVAKVVPVEGGFQFSGRWGFSSGSEHCKWVLLGGLVPPAEPGGAPEYRTFLLPRSDYRIERNWDVLGLCGTGSHDIVVDGVFVPDYRTHKSADGFQCNSPGNAVNTAPLYRLPFAQIFVRAVSTASLGALQGAINQFRAYAAKLVSTNTGQKTNEDTGAQMACAEAQAAADEMRVVLLRNFAHMMALAREGKPLSVETRVEYRFQSAAVAERCATQVNRLLRYCGGRGIYLTNPLTRVFLDTHAARAHVANNIDPYGRNYGGVLMGQNNRDFFI
ncbi:acyl-CoA dehydrogenase family protein [Pseudoduganella sp. UC29_106]|uniref:acyl-CoA dehydrogenase family protein n=1 Tax=Pseudoduganella sp. UC29_106 TaxID=3374553 RepID=UPI003756E84E